jgi:esterase/lipase superfamily enzyme
MGSRRRPLFLLVIPIVSLWLGGCAGRIKGFLEPVAATVPGASQVEMVVTTMRKSTEPAEMFSGARASSPAFANIIVSIPPDETRAIGEVQWPQQIPGNPATDFVTLKADIVDKLQALASFHNLVQKAPKRQALVFVHGFNNRFEDAVFRFAQIVHDTGADVAPVLFSWPSKGSSFAYEYDRESAIYSRDALEDLLRSLSKDPRVGEVTVLAHSIGNWVTLEALRQMAIRDGKVADKIRNVLLAAPDVDVDVARLDIAAMGPQRPNFILFVSEGKVWGSLARERIDVVDPTRGSSADQLHHGTFAESSQVVDLIGRGIASGQTLTDSRVDLIMATTISAAVGTAASLVLGIWQFLKDNITVIAAIAAGSWTVFTFFVNKREKRSTPSVIADHSDVAAGRDTSGPTNTNARDDSKR